MGIDDRIVAKLNAELGANVENISRSKDLVNKFVDQLNVIEEKVKSEKFKFRTKKINFIKYLNSAKYQERWRRVERF